MKKTKRNTVILLALTVASAIVTAVCLFESVIAMIIGIIAIPLYFFIFSFLYGCFGVRTTFDESLEKEKESKAQDRIMAVESEMWDEEDEEEERLERRKALRRIKRLQRDYPDSWELLVEPDDEYLCYDYIDAEKKKKEREKEESAGFAAVWSAMNANNAGNSSSSS